MTNELTVRVGQGLAVQAVGDMLESWTKYIDASQTTVQGYTRAVRQFRKYLQANNITAPVREDVVSFREQLKAEGKKPATIQAYIQAVRLFFQWASQQGLYANIAEHIKGAKLDIGHKKDCLTAKQAGKLVTSIDTSTIAGKRDYAIILAMLTGGLRTIEIVRADIGDLRTVADFTALYLQGKGHTEKTQYIKVSEQLEDAIRDYLKARTETGEILQDNSPLFICASNKNVFGRLTTRSVSRIAKTHLVDIGLNSSRITAHSLRHTTATLNLLAGASIEETQQLLRHTNINTTMIYSHALERANNNSEIRITNAIFSSIAK